MSQSEILDYACPACGAKAPVEFWANLDRTARDDVLSGTLQRYICMECTAEVRFPPTLTYLDPEAGLWVSAKPADAVTNWGNSESNAKASFEACFGPTAPAIAQETGKSLRARLTFGWPALQEKLLLSVFELDDVTVELLKLAVLRDRVGNPLSPDTELRVIDIRASVIELAWIDRDTGRQLENFEAPIALYETLTKDDSWAAPRATLEGGLFVDTNKFLFPPNG